LGTKKLDEGKKALALSLLFMLTGPFVMYYSIMNHVTILLWLGLAGTALGMVLALLKA